MCFGRCTGCCNRWLAFSSLEADRLVGFGDIGSKVEAGFDGGARDCGTGVGMDGMIVVGEKSSQDILG